MHKTKVSYQETNYFSKLITDYIAEKEELSVFYHHQWDINSFKEIIKEREKLSINRTVLVEALTTQYASIKKEEQTVQNIVKLKNENCFTVTTGHQLNLFTGPLYFIYKIVSTINLSKKLKTAYPQYDFVPVYWMATEDHDFEEVNHFNLFKKRYELERSTNGAVGNTRIEGVEQLIEELKKDLADRSGAEEIIALFSRFYSSEKTYTQAIQGFVNDLFGKYGLVIIDGNDRALKKEMVNCFKDELVNRTSYQVINSSSDRLKELGYKVQVNPREINLFYLKGDLRERIIYEENKYKVLNTTISFTETELMEELDSFPESFSPNVVLRPLYQEKILPNLAYIGGGGELAYWFQLKEMFDLNNISFPILVLRNSVLVIDKGSSQKLQKLNIELSTVFKSADQLIKEYLKAGSDMILDLKKEEQEIETVFEDLVNKAGIIDKSLQPFVRAELQKSIKSIKNIEHRLIKAEKKKEEIAVAQINNIKERLFPIGLLQERNDNLISLLLFYGKNVIEELMDQLDPMDKQFVLLSKE